MLNCLFNGKGYTWTCKENICVRGFFFYEGVFYSDGAAVQYLHDKIVYNQAFFKELDGSFSIVIEDKDNIILATDRLRSLPLFYTVKNGELFVSDNAYSLRNKINAGIDKKALAEFKRSVLWVSGNRTLWQDIKGVQAGEVVIYTKTTGRIENKLYFREDYSNYILNESKTRFWNVYDKVGEKLVQALEGNTAVLPLSGGADSRMILDMLKRQNYTKIICFTYGKKNDKEVLISKRVAENRNVPWIFIEFTETMWKQLVVSGEFYAYSQYAGNGTSLPHMQDYLAVRALRQQKLIPDNSIFIPGHSGDMLAGSHITEEFLKDNMTGENFVCWFVRKFYNESNDKQLRKQYKHILNLSDEKKYDSAYLLAVADEFNRKERQGKFIVNSVRTYEYFGYKWLIPLWSNELMEYWSHISIDEKYERKLYFECIGKEAVTSTNKKTLYNRILDFIHKFSAITIATRKLSRIKAYFTDYYKGSKILGFWKYLWLVLWTPKTFSVNNLFQYIYLNGEIQCTRKIY